MRYTRIVRHLSQHFGLPERMAWKIMQVFQTKALECLHREKRINVAGLVIMKLKRVGKVYTIDVTFTKIVRDWLTLYNIDKRKARSKVRDGC